MSRSFRLGLFMLTTLAILAAGVFMVGRQESKFGSNYLVRSDFANVAGLSEGADVRVGGIRKGTVRSIQLPKTPDGKVVVVMDLGKGRRRSSSRTRLPPFNPKGCWETSTSRSPSVRWTRRDSRTARPLRACLRSISRTCSRRPVPDSGHQRGARSRDIGAAADNLKHDHRQDQHRTRNRGKAGQRFDAL
jgi:hypothetical protein